MNTIKLDIRAISKLAANCFLDDPFYQTLDRNRLKRKEKLQNIFQRSFKICLQQGFIVYTKINCEYVAFCLGIHYATLKKHFPEDYKFIFKGNTTSCKMDIKLTKEAQIIDSLIDNKDLYLLAIAVNPLYRRLGIASQMIHFIQTLYPDYNLFSDVTNKASLELHRKLGFTYVGEYSGCTFVRYIHPSK